MKGIDPKWAMYLGLLVTIEQAIGHGTVSLTNLVPESWAPYITSWCNFGAFVGTAIMTYQAAVSAPVPGPAANTPISPTAVVRVLLVAFVVSAFLAVPSAMAQTRRPALQITGDVVKDTKANFGLTGNASGDMQALWQKIVGSSLNDLNYASAMASSANTSSSAVRLQCIKAIIKLNEQASGVNLKNPDGTPMAKPDPHAFTDVESLAEIVDNLAPQGPLFVNCAGAAQLAKTNVLSFVNALVTGAAGLAAMPVIPGL